MQNKTYWKNDEARDGFINRVLGSIEEERTWILGQQGRTKPDTPQALGTGVVGPVALANRRVVKLTMNQAVVADLRELSFHSDNFSSCSPVAMYNAGSHRGGLFHFPGGGLGGTSTEDTKRRLRQMYTDVNPTDVRLNSRFIAPTEWDPMGQTSDVPAITNFLQDELGYAGAIHAIPGLGGAYSFYLDAVMTPQAVMGDIPVAHGAGISAMQDRTKDERGALAVAWQGLPAAMKYGIDEFSHLAYD